MQPAQAVFASSNIDPLHIVEYAALVVLSVLLHELGHALTAKRFGLTGLSIMLHGFGGFAVSRGYRNPSQALIITLMGPAITFVIGGVALVSGTRGFGSVAYGTEASMQFHLLRSLGHLNLLLGVLNLLPSLPFDGGHAVHALLTTNRTDFKATRLVAHLGIIVGPGVFIAGLFLDMPFVIVFGLMGAFTSIMTAVNSGGVRFSELLAERRERKEMLARKLREKAKSDAYLADVIDRQRARDERERLRKLLDVQDGGAAE